MNNLENAKHIMKNMKHGIYEEKIGTWNEFLSYVNGKILDHNHYIWRGQKDFNWELNSTLTRIIKASDGQAVSAEKHLENFKLATRGRNVNNLSIFSSDDEWWALGQHYGLFTPLLDWTRSPFVAAYFAFANITEENADSYCALYGLHISRIKSISDELSEDRRIDFINPLSGENHRLVNQNGLFSKSPINLSIEEWLLKYAEVDEKKLCLIKILIPQTLKAQILRSLNRMNINHLSLFPDLIGSSVYCNLYLNDQNY